MTYSQMCPKYEAAIAFLGKKWTGLLIRVLLAGPQRFSDFRQQIPELSDRLLSERLKELQDLGLVERRVENTQPVTIEYCLTKEGERLEQVVQAIQDWAETWSGAPTGTDDAPGSPNPRCCDNSRLEKRS